MEKSHKIIYSIYILIWIILAINPKYPEDWFLENILVFLLFPFVLWSDIKYKYTLLSIFFLLIFASLHSLGAHFTYAKMEYFDFITQLFGFERNHFDRVVHFLFGLLVFRSLSFNYRSEEKGYFQERFTCSVFYRTDEVGNRR